MHYKYTDIKAIVAEILENKKDEGGVKNIYFVGCGGSLGALYPAKTFMERESLTLKSGWVSSNEFVHSTPRDFGKNSIICLACHKGNTPETIAAAKLGKEMGAAVIILTWLEESEIIEFGDYIIHYSFDASPDHLAGDIDYAGEKTMCALQVAVELLNQTEGYSNYDKFQQGAGMITTVIRKARAHVAQRALDFAEEYKNDSVIYTMGSGAGYGAAYMRASASSWRCSGSTPAPSTPVSSSMAPSKSPTPTPPSSFRCPRVLPVSWTNAASSSCTPMQSASRCWTPRSWACRSSIPLSWTTSTTLCSTMSIPSTITPSLRPASIR